MYVAPNQPAFPYAPATLGTRLARGRAVPQRTVPARWRPLARPARGRGVPSQSRAKYVMGGQDTSGLGISLKPPKWLREAVTKAVDVVKGAASRQLQPQESAPAPVPAYTATVSGDMTPLLLAGGAGLALALLLRRKG